MTSTPRWLEAINKALSHPDNKGKIIYQVASIDARNKPRVRSQVHRGFFTPDDRPDLPLLVTSTDARSAKVAQLLSNQHVELAWWMEGSQEQFRLSGYAHIRPSPTAPGDESRPTPIPADAAALKALEAQGFDWETKRRALFAGMSPGMRASWCVPRAPGSALASAEEQEAWPRAVPPEPSSEEDARNYEAALSNFALMLVEPVEVDWVELGVKPQRRTFFKREGEKWVEQPVVP
ncbi:pyridoxamine 5'-phosphate oxidase-domain-containing protein [Trametes elegans]|nr:pyridoxamine 5'-phosphate oxidase-domain-containing protein [Trametes elegans]